MCEIARKLRKIVFVSSVNPEMSRRARSISASESIPDVNERRAAEMLPRGQRWQNITQHKLGFIKQAFSIQFNTILFILLLFFYTELLPPDLPIIKLPPGEEFEIMPEARYLTICTVYIYS